MDRGYVKLWRKSLTGGWLRNRNVWVFWSYCLMKASHKEHKVVVGNQEISLEKGQFIFGRRRAAEDLDLSEQEIRTCIDFLRKDENITIKSTNKFSVITVVNWDTYQGECELSNQQSNQRSTSNQPAINQQVTTYKNGKNVENEKKDKYSDDFSQFWNAYPGGVKGSKKKAFEAWLKFKKEEVLPVIDSLLNVLALQAKGRMILKRDGRFVPEWPHVVTYINQARWEEEFKQDGDEANDRRGPNLFLEFMAKENERFERKRNRGVPPEPEEV